MTFCDPPYGVNYANTPKDKLRGKHRPILNDNLGAGFETFLYDACANILAVTKGAVYVCMCIVGAAHAAAGLPRPPAASWSTFVIWAKNTFTLGRADYQRQYEPILYGWKDGTDHYWCGARDQGDVWFFDKPVRERSAPDDEAGGAGRAGDPELEQNTRHRARPVRRFRLDAHRLREDRAAGAADRARSEVRGHHRRTVATVHGRSCLPRGLRRPVPTIGRRSVSSSWLLRCDIGRSLWTHGHLNNARRLWQGNRRDYQFCHVFGLDHSCWVEAT